MERKFERQANVLRGMESPFTYSIVFTVMKVMFVSYFFFQLYLIEQLLNSISLDI